jgi:hypothetical protein
VAVVAALSAVTASTPAVAAADAYAVKITGLPERFQTGQAGVMSVSATRQAPECSRVRALMLISLPGIDYGQLKVEVRTGSGWENSPISRAGDNTMRAEDNWIDVNFLCQGQVRVLEHRITFLPGAPAGSALIDVVISSHGDSAQAGRANATRPVVKAVQSPAPGTGKASASAGAPSSSASSSAPPSGPPSETPEPEGVVGRVTQEERETDAVQTNTPTRPAASVGLLGGGGTVLLALTALLFGFLIRRRNREADESG